MTAGGAKLAARLRGQLDAVARALGAGGPQSRHLLAGMKAAELLADPSACTRAEVMMAENGLLARELALRLHAIGEAALAAPLADAAERLLAEAGSWRLPPGSLEAFAASVRSRFAEAFPSELVDALGRGDAARHSVDTGCRPHAAPVRIADGAPGRRLRVLAADLHASPYAPTAQLVALPTARALAAADAGSSPTLSWPWNGRGWAETGLGEGLGFVHTGRIPSHYAGSLVVAAI